MNKLTRNMGFWAIMMLVTATGVSSAVNVTELLKGVQPIDGQCPKYMELNETGMCVFEEGCRYKFDNTKYMVSDTIILDINCPYLVGEDYLLVWESYDGRVYREEIGVLEFEHQAYFKPMTDFVGYANFSVPSADIDERLKFTVYPKGWFFTWELGDATFRVPNVGKIVAGKRTPEIVGWVVVFAAVWGIWSLILALPDLVYNKINKRWR